MTRWIRVAPCEAVPLREGRAVLFGDRELALFNLGDRFLATDNRCPHQGGPLCDGIVTGTSVVCPLHAWKVNLASGAVERPPGQRALRAGVPDAGRRWRGDDCAGRRRLSGSVRAVRIMILEAGGMGPRNIPGAWRIHGGRMADYFREPFEGLTQTAEGLIQANQGIKRPSKRQSPHRTNTRICATPYIAWKGWSWT